MNCRFEYLQKDLRSLRTIEMRDASREIDTENQERNCHRNEEDGADEDEELMDDMDNESECSMRLCYFGLSVLNGNVRQILSFEIFL